MADGEVKIETKLDTSGLDKGLKDMKNKLDEAGKILDAGAKTGKGFADNLKGISSGAVASAGAVADVAEAVKKTVDALNDCEAAYKVQRNAEIALQQAAKNNPYLNDKSVYNLRNFASDMSAVTGVAVAVKKTVNGLNDCVVAYKGQRNAELALQQAAKNNPYLNDESVYNLRNFAAGMSAVTGVGVAVKKTVNALNDCEAAYKVQRNAEIALQQAAKNNPYLNDESVYNLRNFASELQSMSDIGDEQSLKVMARLAAMGRTEEQIQAIMKAAADMSAGTGNSIENIAVQLNKTYSGLSGEIGEANSEIRALTKEELEAGKAIDIIAKQYNGQAAAMADTNVQLANAWGDFKENIGRGWNNVTQPVKQFFLDVLNSINEATAKTKALKDAEKKDKAGTATTADKKILLKDAQEQLDSTKKTIDETMEILNNEELLAKKVQEARGYITKATYQKLLTELQGRYEEQTKRVQKLTEEYNNLSEAEKKAADATAAQKQNEDAAKYIKANTKALQEQIKTMELKASVTGEEIDAGEMYNAYMQSYIDLITKSNGLVTENNQAAKERLATLQEWAQKAKDAATEEERLAAAQKAGEAALQAAESLGYNSKFDEYKAREEELLQMKKDINAAEIEDADKKRKALENIDEELVKNRRNLWNDIASEVNGYSQQVGQIINDAAQMALETENNKMRAELANLEIKYRKGELGEEEYQKKVAEAKKKGAKIQYQIEMAQWASNILTATANTAVGVTQALAKDGIAGIITGALVGAAGAVQLASIMAAKPIQHFAAGGFVGGINGASMGADNTTIAARGGELVMNANQQRALWDMINGTGSAAGAGGVNLTINNNAANLVNVKPQITRGQIELMIDARVNDGLKSGRFNSGLNAANAGMSGEFYGI